MTLSSQKSTFPTAVGLRVTGVDDSTFSVTGNSYSAITMAGADTHVPRLLQEDDTSLAYEFARKFRVLLRIFQTQRNRRRRSNNTHLHALVSSSFFYSRLHRRESFRKGRESWPIPVSLF